MTPRSSALNRLVLSLVASAVIASTNYGLAQTAPPAVPPGPLGDVDTAFLEEYVATMKAVAKTHPIYVEMLGNNLVLHRNGQEESVRVLPDIYHALKDVAHVPFVTYLELAPIAKSDGVVSSAQISELQTLSEKIVSARGALRTGNFNNVQLPRQQQLIDVSLDLLRQTMKTQKISQSSLETFAKQMGPLMMESSNEAGCYQVQEMHAQMMRWKKTMTSDEWNNLIAINKSGHQPRYRNVATQYFGWLFNAPAPKWAYPGESMRVIYAESQPKTQSVEDELVSILIDADVSTAFLGDRWRLSEDVLSDGAARCIAQFPVTDRDWH
jgi:quinol monooxygenase YgiN